MFYIYILYSYSADKTYVGYTNNLKRRLTEHNFSDKVRYTKNFRPWIVFHHEAFESKSDAMYREKFYKSGIGRELKKKLLVQFLLSHPSE
jgi:putative endonuclease